MLGITQSVIIPHLRMVLQMQISTTNSNFVDNCFFRIDYLVIDLNSS